VNSNIPGIGDNTQVDYATLETERLESEFNYLRDTASNLKSEAAAFVVVDDPGTKSKVMSLIKRMRDHAKSVLGVHEIEKMPHYRRGQAVDQFFFSIADDLARRDRKAKPGEADRLNQLLTDYDLRELAKEQERRRLIAEEEERKRRAAEQARLKAEQEAAEARLKAERARTEATRAAKEEEARKAEEAAAQARVEAHVAEAKAETTYVDTLAKPSDIMRTRTDDGTLGTMGTEDFAEITNRNELDLEKLRPYISVAALEIALRAYAKANSYSSDPSVQIAGARFGKRPKSRVR